MEESVAYLRMNLAEKNLRITTIIDRIIVAKISSVKYAK
jgi:hypothetical protein